MSINDRFKPPLDHIHVGPYARWHPSIYKNPQDAVAATYSAVSEIINTVGDNTLLYGFSIDSYSYDADNNITITLNPGTCIINGSLVSVSTQIPLNINADSYTDTGKIIVSLIHKTDESNRKRIPIFRIQYVDALGSSVDRGNWIVQNSSVLILGIFEFTKTGGLITDLRDRTAYYIGTPINILGEDYYVYGSEEGFADFIGNANYIKRIKVTDTPPFNNAVLVYNQSERIFEYIDSSTFGGTSSSVTEYSFQYNTSSPLNLDNIQANTTIGRITVYIDTPFDDNASNILVGDAALHDRLVNVNDVYTTEQGTYEIISGYLYTSATQLLLTINPFGSTQGSGRIWIETINHV